MKKTIYILYVLLIFAVVGCVNELDMTPIGEETVDVTVPEEEGGYKLGGVRHPASLWSRDLK